MAVSADGTAMSGTGSPRVVGHSPWRRHSLLTSGTHNENRGDDRERRADQHGQVMRLIAAVARLCGQMGYLLFVFMIHLDARIDQSFSISVKPIGFSKNHLWF